ncbi:MAG TPA: hypothetical protein VIK71_02860 [Flavobacteriales bacterium]
MKHILITLLMGACLTACQSSETKSILVDDWLSEERQVLFLGQLDSLRDSKKSSTPHLEELVYFYELPESGEQYFVLLQPARSIHEKYVAVGGKIQRDRNGDVKVYKEIFRTWKHPKDVVLERSSFLFEKMVSGQDLTVYYSDKMGDTYIEFPNAHIFFDTIERKWVSLHYPLEMKQ